MFNVYMCLFLVCGIGGSVWCCSQRLGSNGCPRGSGPADMQVCGAAEDHKALRGVCQHTPAEKSVASCTWVTTGRPVARTRRRSWYAGVDTPCSRLGALGDVVAMGRSDAGHNLYVSAQADADRAPGGPGAGG